jgi:hypothetical protein
LGNGLGGILSPGHEDGKRIQDLQGDVAIELRIMSPIYLTHAALTDEGDDFIGTKAGAGAQRHRRDSTEFVTSNAAM